MDGVLVDNLSGVEQLSLEKRIEYVGNLYSVPGVYSLMKPMEGALDAFEALSKVYDSYILSTPPWYNTSAWSDKHQWVKKYLGLPAKKRLILSQHKNLNRGDYLIDDRRVNGAAEFQGEHIHFGTKKFPDWGSVLDYLL